MENKKEIGFGIDQETLKKTIKIISPKLEEKHIEYFYKYCLQVGLNPIEKEIFAYTNGQGDLVIATNYLTYLKKVMNYMESKNIDFRYETEIGQDQSTNEMTCECIAYEGDKTPKKVKCFVTEFTTGYGRWKSAPRDMLEKCAIAKMCRRFYPIQCANLPYTSDEIENVETLQPSKNEIVEKKEVKLDNIDLEKLVKEFKI